MCLTADESQLIGTKVGKYIVNQGVFWDIDKHLQKIFLQADSTDFVLSTKTHVY